MGQSVLVPKPVHLHQKSSWCATGIYLFIKPRENIFHKGKRKIFRFFIEKIPVFFYKKFCKTPVSTFEFRISWLKSSFFAEVNSFKNKYLNSYSNDVSINNSGCFIKQLQDNINFLRQQLKNKHKMINSLLQQLSKMWWHSCSVQL